MQLKAAVYIALFLFAVPCQAVPPEVTEVFNYYPIYGKTTEDLRNQMDQLGYTNPNGTRSYGHTEWYVNWWYPYDRSGGQCSTGEVKTTVKITFTLPKWEPPFDAQRDVINEWFRYSEALLEHEMGHKAYAMDAAERIISTLEALPKQSSCDLVHPIANREGNRLITASREEEYSYDQTTNHGATQGARLK